MSGMPRDESAQILVVDDQELMRLSLDEALSRAGHRVTSAADGQAALDLIVSRAFEVVVTDLKMPRMDGLTLLKHLVERSPETPVVVITAHGSIETAVEAMRCGAFDYVQKPFEADEIELVVSRALAHRRLMLENVGLRSQATGGRDGDGQASGDGGGPDLVGSSRLMADLRRQIERVAASTATVLVHGESGSGKELVARAIHRGGPRAGSVFLCVNCAALSAGLLESELFGHERGAFTGADRMRLGRFELAHRGTLLLDEVSEIDLGLQAKLLRVLQEGRFERVGSSVSRAADVRVIATTNRDLTEAVEKGEFRRDLYYRLAVLPVRVPPLREHPEDVPDLVAHFLRRYRAEARGPVTVAPETLRLLERYRWPGNVRELENILRRALVTGFGPELRPEHLAPWLSGIGGTPPITPARLPPNLTLAEAERQLITAALERHAGNRTRAAQDLGISVRTLRDKLLRWREGEQRLIA
jgi:DNA-binding NtrC family response regulator